MESIIKLLLKLKKKWFIRRELKKMFKLYNNKNVKYLKHLTESLINASEITKKSVNEELLEKELQKDEKLFEDVKNVINKHYNQREVEYVKEIQNLKSEIKNKEDKLKNFKDRVKNIK